jgi:drug resistance transporter, EmrB/QacA subfamily
MEKQKITATVLTIGVSTFMSSLDSSVVNLVVPLIRNEYGVSISTVEWIVTAYLLVVSSLLLTFGRLADLYGHKRIYSSGFVIFTAGSLLCGISINIYMLIACRVIQSVGAGMLFAAGPAIITNSVPASSRGKALSVTAVAVALGLCTGPVIGGFLSTFFGWQSIFFINIPIGLLGIILVRKNIPADERTTPAPFDFFGSILIFASLLFILLPLNISGDFDIPPAIFLCLLAAGFFLLIGFVALEKRIAHPLLKTSLFQNRVFASGNAAAFFIYMAQFIMVFLAPFYLENIRQFTALLSGLLFLPMPLATMIAAPVSGGISDRFGGKYITSAGAFIMACGLFMLSFLGSESHFVYIVSAMVVCGIGFGMFQTPNNSAIMGSVPPQNRGTASGTLATMRNTGMVMGVAVSGALFSCFQSKGITVFARLGQTGVSLHNNAFTYALHLTFLIASCVALVSMAFSMFKGKEKSLLRIKTE